MPDSFPPSCFTSSQYTPLAFSPVGVMFHHAIMDAAELGRASELLGLLAGHERASPAPMMELIGSVVV